MVIPTLEEQTRHIEIPHFKFGAGADKHAPGFYAIAGGLTAGTGADLRWGWAMPGPREVADTTGIAAGYRIYKMLRHADVPWLLTYNGTNTKVYRLNAAVWQERLNVNSIQGVELVSFGGAIAVGYGTARAYDWSTDSGANWTASASSGNAKYITRAIIQQNDLTNPRVFYVVNPDLAYVTRDLTSNTASGTSSTIGDNQTTQDAFRSLKEDDAGMLLIAKRRALFSLAPDGTVVKLTRDFDDPPAHAGGQGDRPNFEVVVELEGRMYYVVEGYNILEYFHGQVNEFIAPRWSGPHIPRMDLPINAMCAVGEWLVVALGTQTTNLKNVAMAPGGTALLRNTIGTTSDLWMGHYQPHPTTGQMVMTWHGILLVTTDPLRYMWYDEDDNYLYLCSGDSEAINVQARRCIVLPTEPELHAISGVVTLSTGQYVVELGRIDAGDGFAPKRVVRCIADTLGLAATNPTLEVLFRPHPDYESTAYISIVSWNDNAYAAFGVKFPPFMTFRSGDLQLRGTGNASNNTYAIVQGAKVAILPYFPWGNK